MFVMGLPQLDMPEDMSYYKHMPPLIPYKSFPSSARRRRGRPLCTEKQQKYADLSPMPYARAAELAGAHTMPA